MNRPNIFCILWPWIVWNLGHKSFSRLPCQVFSRWQLKIRRWRGKQPTHVDWPWEFVWNSWFYLPHFLCFNVWAFIHDTSTCSNKFLLYSDPCSVSPYKLWNWIDSYHLVLEFMTSLMTPTYHTSFRDLIRPSQHHHEVLLHPTRRSIRSTCSTVSVYDVLFLE